MRKSQINYAALDAYIFIVLLDHLSVYFLNFYIKDFKNKKNNEDNTNKTYPLKKKSKKNTHSLLVEKSNYSYETSYAYQRNLQRNFWCTLKIF